MKKEKKGRPPHPRLSKAIEEAKTADYKQCQAVYSVYESGQKRRSPGVVHPRDILPGSAGLELVGRFNVNCGTRPVPENVPDLRGAELLRQAGAPEERVNEALLSFRKPGGWKHNIDHLGYFAAQRDIPSLSIHYIRESLLYLGDLPLRGDTKWAVREKIREVGLNPEAYAGFFSSRIFGGNKLRAATNGLLNVMDVYDSIVNAPTQLYATSVYEIGGRDKVVDDPSKPSRVVLMDDFVPTVIGTIVVKDIQKYFSSSKTSPIYVGSSWQKCGWMRFFTDIDRDVTIENDWSKFDSTVPEVVIRYAFSIVASCYEVGPDQKREVDRIMSYLYANFVNSLIMTPGGFVYRKRKGIPSGSAFTSLIGSLCNWIVLKAGLATVMRPGYGSGSVGSVRLTIAGDDSTMSCDKINELAVVLGLANSARMFGMIQKPSALKITTKDTRYDFDGAPTFLGYTFRCGYPERREEKLIESVIHYDYIQGKVIRQK
jgi:hypothetical protein